MYGGIIHTFWQLLALTQLILAVLSLIHLARTRSDAYPAASKQSKQFWALLLSGALLLGLLQFLVLVSLIISLIYLLDVRPAVDEVQRPRW